MQDLPRNRFEQQCHIPSTGAESSTCYNLRPGSLIYVPPGHWHQVSCVAGNSFSVDLRVGSILQSRWICEAIFAGLLDAFHDVGASSAGKPVLAVGPADFALSNGLGAGVVEQIQHIKEHIDEFVQRTPVPRCFPFQIEHSDGLRTGATLEFLERTGFLAAPLEPRSTIVMSGLVAMALKVRDSDTLLVQLTSVSSLTTMEYLRYTILCNAAVVAAMSMLQSKGRVCLAVLQQQCAHEDLLKLLRVLVHGNIMRCELASGAEAVPGSARKRKRTSSEKADG